MLNRRGIEPEIRYGPWISTAFANLIGLPLSFDSAFTNSSKRFSIHLPTASKITILSSNPVLLQFSNAAFAQLLLNEHPVRRNQEPANKLHRWQARNCRDIFFKPVQPVRRYVVFSFPWSSVYILRSSVLTHLPSASSLSQGRTQPS